MSNAFIGLPADEAGKKVDAEQLTVGSNDVLRQRILMADPSDVSGFAKVKNSHPGPTDYGVVVRQAPSGLLEAEINISTATDTDVINGHANGLKIWKLMLWVSGDNTVSIKDGTTNLMRLMDVAQGGSLVLPKDGEPWFTCSAAQPFRITTTGTGQVSGRAYYTQG